MCKPAAANSSRARRVDQRAVGFQHDARAAGGRAPHEIGEVAAQRRLAAGEHDLLRVARPRRVDAPPHRRLATNSGCSAGRRALQNQQFWLQVSLVMTR